MSKSKSDNPMQFVIINVENEKDKKYFRIYDNALAKFKELSENGEYVLKDNIADSVLFTTAVMRYIEKHKKTECEINEEFEKQKSESFLSKLKRFFRRDWLM